MKSKKISKALPQFCKFSPSLFFIKSPTDISHRSFCERHVIQAIFIGDITPEIRGIWIYADVSWLPSDSPLEA